MENHHAINGKIHYFDWAIFNSFLYVHQRVTKSENSRDVSYRHTNHFCKITRHWRHWPRPGRRRRRRETRRRDVFGRRRRHNVGAGRHLRDVTMISRFITIHVCVCLCMRACLADILILMHVNVRSLHPFMIMIGVTWWHVWNPLPSWPTLTRGLCMEKK